jgi:hypothetical protein
MHPLFMDHLVDDRQCDLFCEARAANGPAHLRGTLGGRIRRALAGRARERDRSTVHGCS